MFRIHLKYKFVTLSDIDSGVPIYVEKHTKHLCPTQKEVANSCFVSKQGEDIENLEDPCQ